MQRRFSHMAGALGASGLILFSIVMFSRVGKTSIVREPQLMSESAESPIKKELLAAQLGSAFQANQFPEKATLDLDGSKTDVHVNYTLHEDTQEAMQKLMDQYKPDYGAFVAMDAKTGRILSLVSYSREHGDLQNLTLRASFPAASIFKVVTASAALDLQKALPSTTLAYNGANHTLYKKNVESTQVTKWTRTITMREAFAKSINVFFGKLGLFYVGADNLQRYANRYMFNQPIPADLPVEMGYTKFKSDDPWSVVQAASGFTLGNTMSPLQGALIAASVANDGVMMEPFVVDSIVDNAGDSLYKAHVHAAHVVVEPGTAENLRELFKQTVIAGTSRKSFRQTVRKPKYDDVEFGGKTGSLTGESPKGKCDWFVGYARFRDQRIAVAALTVNEKKWRVKSSMLANLYFQRYLNGLKATGQVASAH